MMNMDLVLMAKSKAQKYEIDHNLILAIIKAESNFDTYAMRYEPDFTHMYRADITARYLKITMTTEIQLQKFSYGLMQIMGGVAREMNFTLPLIKLCEPELGLEYGCMKLRKLIDRYKEESSVISAYNAGSPRKDAWGAFLNKDYVNKVLTYKSEFIRQVV